VHVDNPPTVDDDDVCVFLNGILQMSGPVLINADYTFHTKNYACISFEKKLRVNDVLAVVWYPGSGQGVHKYFYTIEQNISADQLCSLDPKPCDGPGFADGCIVGGIGDDASDELKLWDSKRRLG
jgi:hypothetical protein